MLRYFLVSFCVLTSSLQGQVSDEKVDKIIGSLSRIEQAIVSDPSSVSGQETGSVESLGGILTQPVDILWVLVAAALVFFMQIGFCMLELGAVRAKNCLNVVMKNVVDFCVAVLAFLLVGFSLMFGASSAGWISTEYSWLSALPSDSRIWPFWFFQVVFVATAATIASGAMAERTKFVGYLVHTLILSAVTYPILGHWAWGSFAGGLAGDFGGAPGWLEKMGFADFAGSTVVHAVGGAAALAGIIVIGPRNGRFNEDGSAKLIAGHNMPFVAIGTLILVFGWFGFNGGSTLEMSADVPGILVNTVVAAAAGGLLGMFSFWAIDGRADLFTMLNGILSGLVAITACCNVVTPLSALIIGAVAGVIGTAGSLLLLRWKLDDVVGAVPVHLFNGIWGTLCVAIFNRNGFDSEALGVQAIGAFSIATTAFVVCYIVFFLIDKTIGMRADDLEQEDGLDFAEHSATAYPGFVTEEN